MSTGPLYPVSLVLAGRSVLVVGGGPVARAKVDGLLAAGAEVTVIAPEIDPDIRGRPGIVIEQRGYERGDTAGYFLVVTATGDPEVDGQVFADAATLGPALVNSADDPQHCSFVLPAVARRGPITVAVSTEGHSPAMATWLRRRYEAELGPEYVTLLEIVAEHRRELKADGGVTVGLSWQDALDSGMLDLVREGRIAEAKEQLRRCL